MAVIDAEGRIEIEGRVLANTGKAVLFLRDGDEQGVWLPLSKASLLESNRDDRAVVTLPRWLAKKAGML